ncbi:MAG: N-acetylmannosaminyltransferase [uncultured Microvirga sp.]|uniref:N-acetylmannosaminyltransferase n=1 Tax=uncultured Microvirga sp. TaxID=412392 RepID=A0A6J4KZ11_9HYPH|nr:MAG: N-acetylmannosaminyltransferase [uncultured Microvirga sp.]
MRGDLFGLTFTNRRFDELVDAITSPETSMSAPCRLVATANVDHVIKLQADEAFRRAYAFAADVTIDGAPVAWVAALAGLPISGRITGAALFAAVMDRLEPGRHRPVFLVSDTALAAHLRAWLNRKGFAPHDAAVLVPPYGFERVAHQTQAVLDAVAGCRATHIFLGLGAPKSEIFVFRHRERLTGVALCVGAGIAFYFGTMRRAPRLLQRLGLEWLWRLLSEPRRLFRRYLVESLPFFPLALREIVRHRRPRRRRRSLHDEPRP